MSCIVDKVFNAMWLSNATEKLDLKLFLKKVKQGIFSESCMSKSLKIRG